MELLVLFVVSLLISGAVIRLSSALAARLGMLDRPGEHKQHEAVTPFVGGFGVIAVLVSAFLLGDRLFGGAVLSPVPGLILGALLIFLTGLADDIRHLGFKPRFLVQAMVALSMTYIGGVELRSLGELLPGVIVDLGWLAVPMTVFATIGLINAVNMIDGIDGLSGSVSLVSLALIAIVAHYGNDGAYVFFLVALMGGVAGFLYFNLRYPGNRRARVFLGDNGSMLLGFLFAWLFIDLSQGERAAMTPVTALWLFALPLMDTVGVMLRRLWLGKSPFRPDRHHFHHLFVRAGFRVSDIVVVAVLIQLVFALIGVCGLVLGVPDYLMFCLFLGVFAGYLLVILRPWRLVPGLRRLGRWLGLPSVDVCGIFVGYLRKETVPETVALISAELGNTCDYRLGVYEMNKCAIDGRNVYVVVQVPTNGDEHLIGRIQRDALRLKTRLVRQPGVEVRLFMCRSVTSDPREGAIAGGDRGPDRRDVRSSLVYSAERGHFMVDDGIGCEVSVPPPCL